VSAVGTGAVIGAMTGLGLVLIVSGLPTVRRPLLSDRVLPYVRDLLPVDGFVPVSAAPQQSGTAATVRDVFGPSLRRTAEGVGRVLGGGADLRVRLRRAGSRLSVEEFRVEQVLWALAAALCAAAVGLLAAVRGSVTPLPLLVAVAAAFMAGLMVRDQRLSSQVRERERQMRLEFPAVADLLALAVAAGEGPVAALDRVSRVARGHLADELTGVLGQVRTGTPVAVALDRLAAQTGVAVVARFAATLAVAIERGTPLVDVLHAQAADVREAGRRELVETGARKEVLMMVPVVFLVLPVTVVFAFYPGAVGLQLTSP
jgi:tight adherence protein C